MAEDDVEPHAAMDEDDYEDGTAPVHVDDEPPVEHDDDDDEPTIPPA